MLKKIFIIILLIFLCNGAFAQEKTYYVTKGNYYTLFCPEHIISFKINSSGFSSYSMNSDLTNSKSFITFFIQNDGEITVKLETQKEEYIYRLISGTNNNENCDDKFYKLDVENQNLQINKEEK